MPVKPADELAAYFDTAVAAALRDWEEGSRGEVSLPRSRWRAKGYTAAELAAIVVALPGQGPQKLIVKVHPGGRYARETGRHAEAIATSGVFAEQHLVRQPFLRHPVGDGRYLMFQDIAGGDLLESRPLSELPAEGLVAVMRRGRPGAGESRSACLILAVTASQRMRTAIAALCPTRIGSPASSRSPMRYPSTIWPDGHMATCTWTTCWCYSGCPNGCSRRGSG